MEKEELVKIVKEWVRNDNEIRTLQREQSKRRAEKKNISMRLMQIMKTNDIDCFDLNDGQIIYKKKNVKRPITQKILVDILSRYFEGDTDKAMDMNKFILENRVVAVSESIVRKISTKDAEPWGGGGGGGGGGHVYVIGGEGTVYVLSLCLMALATMRGFSFPSKISSVWYTLLNLSM